MIFGIIVLVLVAGIAFYHYLQGLFSAMMSATLAILAAVVAVSYHEPVGAALFSSTVPNYADAVALVGLFALVYVFTRLLTDRLVPGNVRLPVLVDRIGGAVFGLIAGVFAAGILALTAQLLPIGPSIAGYSRYELVDRDVFSVRVPGKYQLQDLTIHGELKADTMDPGQSSGLAPIPADDMLLGAVQYLSNGGSLSGDQTLASAHPSYPDELFGFRLGPAKGGDVLADRAGVSVGAVYSGKQFLPPFSNPEDFELRALRAGKIPVINMSEDAVPVVVRIVLNTAATNATTLNAASIRLVVPDKKDGGQVSTAKDYYPVGSVQRGEVMLMFRPEDVLFVSAHKPIDMVFLVDKNALQVQDGTNKLVMPPGSFVEAKRGARVSLSGKEIAEDKPSDSDAGIMEKDKTGQN